MEIRNRRDREDVRGALEVRDRAWRVGYRGVVDGDLIEAERTEPDEDAVAALADELESEAGAFLVADAAEGADDDGAASAERDDEEDDADGDGPDVVGYVRVRWGATADHVDALDAELAALYVDPARWRDGIGSALLDAAEEWAPGAMDAVATEVLAANERGRAFLEASGFERTGAGETTVGGEALETVRYRRSIEPPGVDS